MRGACRPAKSLSARVKAYHELDDGSLIDLDKGASHGVSEGDTGLLDGEEFVVRDVYRYRCQAWMSGSTDAQASRQAVIYVASDRRTHRASKDGRTSSDDDHSTPPPKAPAGSLRSFTDKKR